MTNRTHASRRRGFTLLELIIAMAIAAALALVLYTSLSTAFKARASAIRQTASMREASIALDIIESDLQSATPPVDTTNGDQIRGPFEGAADSATFFCIGRQSRTTLGDAKSTSSDQDDLLAEGVRQVTYAIAADSTGKNVLMRSLVRNLLPTSTATSEDEQLAGDVAALTFRYYDGTTWTDTWDSQSTDENLLPLAVEASIDIRTTDPRGVETLYHMTRMVPIACGKLPATT